MNYTWVIYIFYGLLTIYIIALLYAKINSPFWFHQPIYHSYELYPKLAWSKKPYFKRKRAVKLGIFCNIECIETWEWSDFYQMHSTHDHTAILCSLLQGYYVDNEYTLFYCTKDYLSKIMGNRGFVSCYRENTLVKPSTQSSTVQSLKPYLSVPNYDRFYGCIMSRPTMVYFHYYPEYNCEIHFWDFLCVHDLYKDRLLSRNLIQTHIYNHCNREKSFSGGYCFLKYNELCKGIVPLVQFDTYHFILKRVRYHKLPVHYRIYTLNQNHIDLWRSIYWQITSTFEVTIMPSFESTIEWLSNERYVIYATVYKENAVEHVHGVYFFEKTQKTWLNDSIAQPDVIRLAGCMKFVGNNLHLHDPNEILFFRGFLNCLQEFLLQNGEKQAKTQGILEIPSIGHNKKLLPKWQEKYELSNTVPCAYYLYNLVYPSSPVQDDLFLFLA